MKTRLVNFIDILNCMRFDGSYHNAEVNIYDAVIKKKSSHKLLYYCSDIFTSGRNKRVYTRPEFGYPFLSNSDVASASPFSSCNYSSKKHGFDPNAVLKQGMILTGRVGAIGQTTFVPKHFEDANAMGSDNIIRIVVSPEHKNGFLYAYLASKIGNLSFWKHATGGVQPFITDTMVGEIPIPDFTSDLIDEIDCLIKDSSNLKYIAFNSLREAQHLIESEFNSYKSEKYGYIKSISIIKDHMTRMDASYYLSDAMSYEKIIKSCNHKELYTLCEFIVGGGRAKRNYTTDKTKGVPYLSNTDLSKANPLRACKLIYRPKNLENEALLKNGMIVTGRVGAIGQTQYIGESYSKMNCISSDNIIRIMPKENNGYIFAFLSSKIGYSLFWKYATGGVQPFISSQMIEHLNIPIFNDTIISKCNELVLKYSQNLEFANIKENLAISLIEQEIEKWNN